MKAFVLALMLTHVVAVAQLSASGAIAGQLRNMDGTPASGVRVGAIRVGSVGAAGDLTALTGLAETDGSGRFRVEGLLPGAYYLTAGFLDSPTFFPGVTTVTEARSVVVAAGSTTESANFSLARSAGVRVAGRVQPLPTGLPREAVRVMLQPVVTAPGTAAGLPVEIGIASDGAFAFARVAPGRYVPRVAILGRSSPGTVIVVDDRDVTGVELAPATVLFGHVEVEGGGSLPVSFNVASSLGAAPDAPSLVQVHSRRIDAGAVNTGDSANFTAVVRSDGTFAVPADPGDYQFAVTQIPVGYYVRSVTYGMADLSNTLLRIAAGTPEGIRILLTTARPKDAPPEVKVSGKLIDLPAGTPASARSITFTMAAPGVGDTVAPAIRRIGEPRIHEDGTFEMLHVPSGSWNITVLNLEARVQGQAQTIFVGDRDVTGIEVTSPATLAMAFSPSRIAATTGGEMFDVRGRFILDGAPALPEDLSRLQLSAQYGNGQRNSIPQGDVIAMQLPEGTYNFAVLGLPAKYTVDSITYGNVDLRAAPLAVNASLTSQIVVHITAFPPRGTFPKVSGHVTNLPAAPYIKSPKIILTRDTKAGGGTMETSMEKDGAFVFNAVPPGPYSVTTFGLTADFTSMLEVTNAGIPDLTIALAGLAVPVNPAASFAANFSSNTEITLRGVITQTVTHIRPNAPVAYIRINVPDASGEPKSWAVVLFNVPRSGAPELAPDLAKLKPGTHVLVLGNPARDGSNRVSLVPRTGPSMTLGIEVVPD